MSPRVSELLYFIKWKLKYDQEYLNEIMPELEQMSEIELTRWAIRHDIIDA